MSFRPNTYVSRFQNFFEAQADVAEAKKESTVSGPYTFTNTSQRAKATSGSNDVWGRPTLLEQVAQRTRNGTREAVDTFVIPDRSPTLISNYVKNLKSGPKDYTKQQAYQRAFAGYSTGSIFSSGIARLGSLTSLFNSVIENPFGDYRNG